MHKGRKSVEAMCTTLARHQEQSDTDLPNGLLFTNNLPCSFHLNRVVVVDTAKVRAIEKKEEPKSLTQTVEVLESAQGNSSSSPKCLSLSTLLWLRSFTLYTC